MIRSVCIALLAASVVYPHSVWDGLRYGTDSRELKSRYGSRLIAEVTRPTSAIRYRVDNLPICGTSYSAYFHFAADGRDALTGVSVRIPGNVSAFPGQGSCMYSTLAEWYGPPKQEGMSGSGRIAVFIRNGMRITLRTDLVSDNAYVYFELAH